MTRPSSYPNTGKGNEKGNEKWVGKSRNESEKSFEIKRVNIMLLYTSLFFISNGLHALYKRRFLYSFLFIFLTFTSVLFYSFPCIYTNLFDKVAILFVVCYGAYLFSFKEPFKQFVISLTFLFTVLFYCFGYISSSFCFGPHGTEYHATLHFISSLGHHLILC